MSDEQEARRYLGMADDNPPAALHPEIVMAIVYPDTLSPELRSLCDEANVTTHDRDEVQRFASFLRGIGRAQQEKATRHKS